MKAIYLEHIRSMREYGVERSTRLQREWAEKPTELRGLEPRNLPGAQAIIDAFLYGVTGEAPYAESAVELLAAQAEKVKAKKGGKSGKAKGKKATGKTRTQKKRAPEGARS